MSRPLHRAEGFVLAGGNSNRMGHEKALIQLAGRPLVQHAVEIMRRAGLAVRIAGARATRQQDRQDRDGEDSSHRWPPDGRSATPNADSIGRDRPSIVTSPEVAAAARSGRRRGPNLIRPPSRRGDG